MYNYNKQQKQTLERKKIISRIPTPCYLKCQFFNKKLNDTFKEARKYYPYTKITSINRNSLKGNPFIRIIRKIL